MLARRSFGTFVFLIPFFSITSNANPLLMTRITKVLKTMGKGSVVIGGSVVAGVVSAEILKELEHAHDDSPLLHVVTYYTLLDSNRMSDAADFWEEIPAHHMDFMRTIEKIHVLDIREINRTRNNSDVLISLKAKQVGKKPTEWRGTVKLAWHENHWLISSMHIKPNKF